MRCFMLFRSIYFKTHAIPIIEFLKFVWYEKITIVRTYPEKKFNDLLP